MVDVSAKDATERIAVAEGRVVMRKETLDLVLDRQRQEGRRARRRAHRRHHGGQAHARADPALPSAADHQGRDRHRAGARAARLPGARDREGHRPDRRRDGGADRGVGRLPDDLRHGQGGRARHAHRGHPPAAKSAAASPAHYRADDTGGSQESWRRCCRSPTRLPRVLGATSQPLPAENGAARRRRTAACWPRISPRCAPSRRPMSRRWTAMRCAPPTSRPRRRR